MVGEGAHTELGCLASTQQVPSLNIQSCRLAPMQRRDDYLQLWREQKLPITKQITLKKYFFLIGLLKAILKEFYKTHG